MANSEFLKRVKHKQLSDSADEYWFTQAIPGVGLVNPSRIQWRVDLGSTRLLSIDDWLPKEAPKPGELFCGLDRSTDAARLAGLRLSEPAYPSTFRELINALYYGTALLAREGQLPDTCFLPTDLWNLLEPAAHLHHYLYTAYCGVHLVEDKCIKTKTAYLLNMDVWERVSNLTGDTLICRDPGSNCRIDFKDTHQVSLEPKCQRGASAVGSNLHSEWCIMKGNKA